MSKQQTPQRYIYKISSSRLVKAKWNLTLPIDEARRNDEVIALSDSQMLRWVDELNGTPDTTEAIRGIRAEIREIKRLPTDLTNRRRLRKLYDQMDAVQFRPDYMHLIIDKDKDLVRACKGFKVNGIRYVRLLGTPGGVKNSTIVFVNEKLAPTLRERINNGRDLTKKMIPAKFEAYRALTCSGSHPVSWPNGILVVPDCETHFREDVIMLNDEGVEEPRMEIIHDFDIDLAESDGYGLMLPTLAERWSKEIGLRYTAGGMNTRCSWEKGMVFAFDFLEFADRYGGGNYIVKDAWGHDIDIRNVELILTTSMLKLWDSYESIDHYMACCRSNHYTFGIPKTAPQELDTWRTLNYQFIQSYDLTDEQIEELVAPTIDRINDVLFGDYRKAILFMRGMGLDDNTVESGPFSLANAIMADRRVFDDPFVKKFILRSIENRIDEAKIGVLDVHGNFSIIAGDPFALCQNIFGLPVTGLLKAGEIYNKYWIDAGAKTLACFRAPMSNHGNVDVVTLSRSEEAAYWYRYIPTCTMMNAWDSICQRLNGAD